MRKIIVKLPKNSYAIIIGANAIRKLPQFLSKLTATKNIIIITNPAIKRLYSKTIDGALSAAGFKIKYLLVPDSETSKSLKYFSSVLEKSARLFKNKPFLIAALGGGVIGDLAGFVAAVYRRGVPYIQIPTTLLAQVDSAIGGKTAIDLTEGKNLVGAFYQPLLVVSDINFLRSLKMRQIKSGLAEIIKYGIVKDAGLFSYINKNYKPILSLKKPFIEKVIYRSSLHKAKIIEKDEFETKGIRTVLNFGHTVGHAIEAATKFKRYSHGEAVSIGMACASDISFKLGLINKPTLNRIIDLLKMVGLPIKIKNGNLRQILKSFAYDKKFIRGYNRLVLIKGIGKAVVKEGVDPQIIKEAIKNVLV